MDKSSNESRQRILTAAKEIFSEQGFDGARVDEIARRANVNKALVYYYFKSKEQILKELLEENISEFLAYKDKYLKDFHVDRVHSEEYRQIVDFFFGFMDSKKDILRIITLEALKGGSANNSIFEFIDPALQDGFQRMEKMGIFNLDVQKYQMAAFFYGLIPIFLFMSLREKWAEYYGYDSEKAMKDFSDLFKEHMDHSLLDIFRQSYKAEMEGDVKEK